MLTLYINMILYGIVGFSMNVHVQSNCIVCVANIKMFFHITGAQLFLLFHVANYVPARRRCVSNVTQ